MRKAILATMLTMLAGPALAETCAPQGKVMVEVQMPALKVQTDAAANVVAKAPWPKAMETSLGPGWSINGLTIVRPMVTTQLHTVEARSAGQSCVSATRAVVTFSFADPAQIYVASKYKPGSCEYEAILAHEHQHVGIHLNTRAMYAPLLKRKVETALTSIGAVRASSPEAASVEMQAKLSETIDEGIREFQAVTARLNGMIDTTENYLALQASCEDW